MQYPLTNLGLHSGFTVINIAQAVVLLPLFLFAFFMYRWENSDLVPIRYVSPAQVGTASRFGCNGSGHWHLRLGAMVLGIGRPPWQQSKTVVTRAHHPELPPNHAGLWRGKNWRKDELACPRLLLAAACWSAPLCGLSLRQANCM